ncbi:MAG TPA: hypothetical protein HA341_06120 [Halobacteria archaeon]|nr:hypothetical protein [Halobacteria archaeon]
MKNIILLMIDLGSGEKYTERLDEDYIAGYLGVKLLKDNVGKDVEPLSPENLLVITTSPFAGLPIPCSGGIGIYSKSPLSGYIGESYLFGTFGDRMARSNYDIIAVKGVSEKPVYLYIDDSSVSIIRADKLRGSSPWMTEKIIKESLNDPSVGVLSIGPAGEKSVKSSTIYSDLQYTRSGLGAVMGSKKLKAIAIRGSGGLKPKNPGKIMDLYKSLTNKIAEAYGGIDLINNLVNYNLPGHNFKKASVEEKKGFTSLIDQIQKYKLKKESFQQFPISFSTLYQVDGITTPVTLGGIAIGVLNGIYNADTIIKAEHLCYSLGIDPLSMAVVMSLANELKERKEPISSDIGWGKDKESLDFIKSIVNDDNIFANGVRYAADKFNAKDIAMHSKGIELSIDAFIDKDLAFNTAVSPSGAYFGSKDFAKSHIYNFLGIYPAVHDFYSDEYIYQLYTSITGDRDFDIGLLKTDVISIEREFNIQQGWNEEDDMLPSRIIDELFGDKDNFLSRRQDFYYFMKWNKDNE